MVPSSQKSKGSAMTSGWSFVIALGSALMDSSAFLAVTGNVPTTQFNRGPFQETGRHQQADFPSVARHYVKRSFQATRPQQLPLMLRQAFAVMLQGRPGPVHLDVPLDVFVETTDEPVAEPGLWRAGVSRRAAAARDDVETALTNARAINLMDDHRMGPSGRQPVEDFLDRTLPTLGHPKAPSP